MEYQKNLCGYRHQPESVQLRSIVLYEALRQQGFESMQRDGELHRLHWKE